MYNSRTQRVAEQVSSRDQVTSLLSTELTGNKQSLTNNILYKRQNSCMFHIFMNARRRMKQLLIVR